MTPDQKDISRKAAAALSRYDIRRPAFNLSANSDKVAPDKKAFFIYPAEAHALVAASLLVLKELDEDKSVSRSTRERFIVEDTKDKLRSVEGQHSPAEFHALYESTMSDVTSKLTGIESLAFSSASGSFNGKPGKLKA